MSIKARISNGVSPSGIRSRISPEFHKLVDDNLLRDPAYTVVSFPGMRGDSTSIVDSKTLAKAFHNQAPEGERIVAVAHNFTAEARDLLAERNAICLSTSEFYWSDESWANIRDK